MTEAKLQKKFTRWLKEEWSGDSAAFELKVSKDETLDYSKIPDHQLLAMKNSGGEKGIAYKISDASPGYKPFDCFFLREAMSFFVIGFNGGKDVYMIETVDIWDKIVDKQRDRRKGSISREWCEKNGARVDL